MQRFSESESEGDFEAARQLVEKYAVNIDPDLHREILAEIQEAEPGSIQGFHQSKDDARIYDEGSILSM